MSFTTEGIILRSIDYGESDRIFSLLTSTHGKISIFVPGARRSKKRSAQALDLFVKIAAEVKSRRGRSTLLRLADFHYLDFGLDIRKDLRRIIAACVFLESVQKLTAEMDHHPQLFELLDGFLTRVGEKPLENLDLDLGISLFHLLAAVGFQPCFDRCTQCGASVDKAAVKQRYYFTAAAGGITCSRCRVNFQSDNPIDGGALKTVQQLTKQKIPLQRIRLRPQLSQWLQPTLFDMIQFTIGAELKSLRLLPLMAQKKDNADDNKRPTIKPRVTGSRARPGRRAV